MFVILRLHVRGYLIELFSQVRKESPAVGTNGCGASPNNKTQYFYNLIYVSDDSLFPPYCYEYEPLFWS